MKTPTEFQITAQIFIILLYFLRGLLKPSNVYTYVRTYVHMNPQNMQ